MDVGKESLLAMEVIREDRNRNGTYTERNYWSIYGNHLSTELKGHIQGFLFIKSQMSIPGVHKPC
jgi:hypothetical protein